ncbi:MAG TPA: AbrB family transcriptional regulator, partial [Candidatus Competibacteraceae bacterium]|nr:AbrB family transcriptional regulator [Candidatus Competibacteraceae bacterium]
MLTAAQARSIVCSLAIGAVGGVLFHALQVPLAWMLGPMCFNILAALLRLPVHTPPALRNGLLPVLGVYLGSSFTPETVERAGQWPWSLAGVMLFVFLCTALVAWYYRRVAGFDRITALFSAGPGALTAMILTGAALGGDERRIALAQSLRLTLLVLVLPPLIFALSSQPPRSATLEVAARAFDLRQLALLAVGCALSVLLFKRLHVPTPQLAGPMLASAVLYLSGLVALDLPHWLLEATLWILGSAVG